MAMKALMKDTGMEEGEAWQLLQIFIKNSMRLVNESQEDLEKEDDEKLAQSLRQMLGSAGNLYLPVSAAGVALAESCLETDDHKSLRSALQKIQKNLVQISRGEDVDDKYRCYATR